MTDVTDSVWELSRRPWRPIGLDPWEFRLSGLPALQFGPYAKELTEVEQLVTPSLRWADEMCPGSFQCAHIDGHQGRVRPVVTLAAADFGRRGPEAVVAATVVELIHLAAVCHDRVQPGDCEANITGCRNAILAGDLLYAEASRLVLDLGTDAMEILCDGMARMAEGQLRASAGPASGEDPFDHYRSVVAARNGGLLAAAARLGGLVGGVDAAIVDAVVEAVDCLAVSAQFIDDACAVSEPAVSRTGPVAPLAQVLAPTGGNTAAASQLGRTWADAAHAALEPLPARPGRQLLAALVDRAVLVAA
jgi:Polyprenyl synthetase